MRTFRLGEDIPLEAKSVTTTLNQVQVQVEEYFSEIRGQLLEYDAILSTQRDTIYQRRARMLTADAESSQTTLREWCVETMDDLVRGSQKGNDVDVEALHGKVRRLSGYLLVAQCVVEAAIPHLRRYSSLALISL